MKYDKHDRQAIKQLSGTARALFEVIEREEKGEIVNIPGLCSALEEEPKFVLFSCLSGDGKRESLGQDLGVLFTTRLRGEVENFMSLLKTVGLKNPLLVIVDDTEPVRFWKWKMDQTEVTLWCRMVVEDTEIPASLQLKL